MATAFIGLGGNLGDVLACFHWTLGQLAALPSSRVVAVSRAYRTHALMAEPTQLRGPDYWNAAAKLDTELAPEELLAALHAVELTAGRTRRARWEARSLDLDLLAYDEVVHFDTGLMLPHPEIARRIFVLAPLADIAPRLVIGGRSVTELLATHDARELLEVRSDWWS